MNRRPSNYLAMLEMPRALLEFASLIPSTPALHSIPSGDGHPVLVLPGFLGSDSHTSVLRQFLSAKKYKTKGWGLGTNLGLNRAGGIEALLEKLEKIYEENNRSKVSLVGWSLGGVFARRMAMEVPEKIRQVICLGSPIGDPSQSAAFKAYQALNHDISTPGVLERYIARNNINVPVPATAIYSKTDGVVPHHIAREVEGEHSESIEVLGSHSGLIVNPLVFSLVGQKLAQERWQKLG